MKTDPSHLNGTRCSHIMDHDYAPFQPNPKDFLICTTLDCVCVLLDYILFFSVFVISSGKMDFCKRHVNPKMVVVKPKA